MLWGMGIADRRNEYETAGLDRADLDADPIVQWQRWYDAAVEAGCTEPNAMVLSTVDDDGRPDGRFVLVRGADAAGVLVLHEPQLAEGRASWPPTPQASLTFGWLELHRQVRVRGRVEPVDAARPTPTSRRGPGAARSGRGRRRQSSRAGRPGRAGGQGRRRRGALRRRRRCPDRRYWGGYRVVPDAGRVLAGPAEPPPRPVPLQPHGGRPVADRAPLALKLTAPQVRAASARPSMSACGVRRRARALPVPPERAACPAPGAAARAGHPAGSGRFTGFCGCRPRSSLGMRSRSVAIS